MTWSNAAGSSALPVVQLCGNEVAGKRTIAGAACALVGLNLSKISAGAIPIVPGELEAFIRLWEREAALGASALLIDFDGMDTTDAARERTINQLIECTKGALIIASRERRIVHQRQIVTFNVYKPTPGEQCTIWKSMLGRVTDMNGQVEAIVSQFNLSTHTIHDVCAEAQGSLAPDDNTISSNKPGDVMWDACRVQTRPRMSDRAQHIESVATWDDLVLPEQQHQIMREIAVHVRQRFKVYEKWGFASKGQRGLGISALFVGASGTGKTMAAEVLANELRLDLYRIDLSQVVSKYIGETEKNLGRIFDAAEEGGAILLFDEADALFGKRSEVKDSHDRYANIEVSYLLQRMESYRGLAILTTNMKSALDSAFLRRIRFIVQFPFPDTAQRAEIWGRIFPSSTPTEGIDVNRLSKLNIAGGNIRNIALNAAFIAADADEPVRMMHLLRAARGEYAKLEKPLTEAEIGGWV
ncbi:MAG: ATP-binding protein [Candidatus Methanoperedens sp.]|nr:ATP-binding protein [Candidatus Methanoperedens sp.]